MMNRARLLIGSAAAATLLASVSPSFGAVMLSFGNPSSASVAPDGQFTTHVLLTITGTAESVFGIDYRIQVADGSNKFRFVSRESTAVFRPFVADTDSAVAPVILAPSNGNTDLGGDRNNNPNLTAAATYDVATLTLQALSTTTSGKYTLSFTPDSTYSTGTADLSFGSLGTFAITVPEPASMAAVGGLGVVALRRRRAAR